MNQQEVDAEVQAVHNDWPLIPILPVRLGVTGSYFMQTYILLNSSVDRTVLRHELGHALQFYAGDANVTLGAFYKLLGLPGTVDDYYKLGPEWFADAFAIATLSPTPYVGAYPRPVPLPPVEELLAFFHSLPLAPSIAPSLYIPQPPSDTAPTVVIGADPAPTVFSIEWLGGVPNTNYHVGRDGNPVTLIVDHWTTGSFDSAVRSFRSFGVVRSAHFVISQTGRIVQMVSEDDTAYHAGVYAKNQISIGIEHEAGPTTPPTDIQYAASAWLHRHLSEKHAIPLVEGETVLRHQQIVPTECPGTLDIARIIEEAEGEIVDDETKQAILQTRDYTKQLFDVMQAFAKTTFPTLEDRLGDGRDVITGGPDKTASKP